MIATQEPASKPRTRQASAAWAWGVILSLCLLHAVGSLGAMGGWREMTGPSPLLMHDHPLHQHAMATSRVLLARTGLPAGYDPAIMSGYPKSVVFPQSDTLLEVVAFLTPGVPIPIVYKVLIFTILATLPWWMVWAGGAFRLSLAETASALGLFLIYVWTEGGGGGFPLNYALYGMLTFLMGVPVSLVATGYVVRYLEHGATRRLLGSCALTSLAFLVHPTAPLIVAPATLLAYAVACRDRRMVGRARHLGFWSMPVVVLVANAFWWLPGFWLRGTKGDSGFAFFHPEPVLGRLGEIFLAAPPIQSFLMALGLVGAVVFLARSRIGSAALVGFAAAGLGWGYLAGGLRSLDFLQPGRQTYALYASACLFGGVAVVALARRLAGAGRGLAWVAVLGVAMIGLRVFGPAMDNSIRSRLGLLPIPQSRAFLSSKPNRQFTSLLQWIKANVRPGERVFYEEVGFGVPGDPDPFGEGRYSGLLPQMAGVEIVGGPYLHAAVEENFTQIGEGKLFGEAGWSREQFLRFAQLYRPSAFVCWSKAAREFCRRNPDLIRMTYQDGPILAGRVEGFGGATIRGEAEVAAEPGRLKVRNMKPGTDGRVVLRYHHAPGLRTRPPTPIDAVQEADPVPFIGLRPASGQTDVDIDLAFPPR